MCFCVVRCFSILDIERVALFALGLIYSVSHSRKNIGASLFLGVCFHL